MAANVNNYIAAGRAAVQDAVGIQNALADNKPRYDKIAKESIQKEALNRANIATNNARTADAVMDAKRDVAIEQMEADTAKDIRGIKKQSRMTGMLAGGAALLGIGAMQLNKKDEVDPTFGVLSQQLQQVNKRIGDTKADIERLTALGETLDPDNIDYGTSDTSNTNSDSSSKSSSSSSVNINGTGSKPKGGSSTGLRLVKDLVNKGYSPISAAAIAGNAQYESDNFRAYEEYSPNSYGTKGAGFLQWTNAGGANRRDAFENWAKSNNLDPASYEASAGYIDAEMRGGNNWTGGQTLDGFKGISNLNEATANYMNTYLRPAKDTANLSTRQSNANILYQNYLDSLK